MLSYRLNRDFIWNSFILLLLLSLVLSYLPISGSQQLFTSAYNPSRATSYNASVNHIGHIDKASSIKAPSSPAQKTAAPNEAEKQKVLESYGKLPISFVPNKGQINSKVKYYAQGAGYNFYLTKDEITYSFLRDKPGVAKSGTAKNQSAAVNPGANPVHQMGKDQKEAVAKEAYALKLKFVGSNPNTTLKGNTELAGKVNYLVGNDKSDWKTDISTYSQVVYENLYPGIDLTYKGDQGRIKYEFVVAPGADHKDISLLYQGASSLKLDKNGDLIINTPWGSLKDEKPYVYQVISGKKKQVNSEFSVAGNNVAFSVVGYNKSYPLIIDPGLVYSTFLGGSGGEEGYSIAVDANGNAYIAGYTTSSDFPTTVGTYDTSLDGNTDVFITKLNSNGSALVYSTFLGGSGGEAGNAIALDASENAYITGYTTSPDFPTSAGAYDTSINGPDGYNDAFIAKLSPDGSALIYSTFLGGSINEYGGYGIALDASGNAYITGYTESPDFPTTVGAYDTSLDGNTDVFITKLNSNGSALVYSTFLGGSGGDAYRSAVTVDSTGNAYITGTTSSSDFPTTAGTYDTSFNGGYYDAFVTKLNSNGSALVYSTFLGGSGADLGCDIALDAVENAYITGGTGSSDFPTTVGAYDTSYNGADVFITKLNSNGSALVYSTFLGGSGGDRGYGIALDASGNAYITGYTESPDFPTTVGAYDTSLEGANHDAFVAKLNTNGSAVNYATFIGGISYDDGYDIAVNGAGEAYITGQTEPSNFPPSNFPVTPGAYDVNPNGTDAFVAKFNFMPLISTILYTTSPTAPDGTNGWFKTTPTIHLDRSLAGSTYFKWNNEDTQTYSDPFPARDGKNVLYYWSKDTAGNVEAVQSQVIKVNTTPWQQVSPDGFGSSANISTHEATYFNGYIYGKTFNSSAGAEVWRTADGTNWEQVASSGFGDTNNMVIFLGKVLNGALYLPTENTITGTEIWKTSDGTTWTQANTGGFGDQNNIGAQCLGVESGYLYFGTRNTVNGTEVWRTDGTTWEQINADGFGDANNLLVTPGLAYGGYVYAVTENNVTGAEVWRFNTQTSTWTQINTDGFGGSTNFGHPAILNGQLYVGTLSPGGGNVYRYVSGTEWTPVASPGFGDANNIFIRLAPNAVSGTLYAGTLNSVTGAEVWKTTDGNNWTQINTDGFGDAKNEVTWPWLVSNGYLYAGTKNSTTGGQIWRLAVADEPADTNPPTTGLTTNPTSPDGTNGWFKTTPSITLTRNEAGTTYFKWNNEDTQTYSAPFAARERINVLHYWSQDIGGNTEEVNHQIFNVDTAEPSAFDLNSPANGSSTTNTSPTLSWNASSDTNSGLSKYQLYIDGSLSRDNISASETSTTPGAPLSNGSHTWYVKAIDNAGNARQSSSTWTIAVNPLSQPLSYMLVTPVCRPGWGGSDPAWLTPVLRYQFADTGPLSALSSIPPYPDSLVNDPSYAAFSSEGELFVANRHGNIGGGVGSIARFKFDSNGNFIDNGSITGNSLEAVHGLVFSPSGELFASNYLNGTISRFLFDAQGNASPNGTIAAGQHNQGLAFNSSGELFVAQDSSTIKRYLFDSNTGAAISNGSFVVPGASRLHGLSFSQTGELFAADAGTSKVHRCLFDSQGSPVSNGFISVAGTPIGVAFSPAGELFVTSQSTVGISRFLFDINGSAIPNGSTALDDLGGVAITPFAVNIDLPPTTTLSTNPSSSDGTNGWFKTTPSITLTSDEPGVTYYKWEYESAYTAYSEPITAPEGQHTLSYYSEDTSGNRETTKSQLFKVDTQAPSTPTIITPSNGATLNNQSVTITGAAEALSTIVIYDNGTEIGSGQILDVGSFSLTVTLSPGTHTLTAQVRDEAGNISPSSSPVSITIEQQSSRTTNTLISDSPNGRIIEVAPDGNIVWSISELSGPLSATRLANGNTLFTENGANRVVEVNAQKQTVWQYSIGLNSPRHLQRLANGNTLIPDGFNHRVIEVDASGNVIWQYGVTGVAGGAPGQLNGPMHAQRLADGNTLISDKANNRVIEVRTGDYPNWTESSVLWQYGATSNAGNGPDQLNAPRRAVPLSNGNILISDGQNHRIIEVTLDKQIAWQYGETSVAGSGPNQLNDPRQVQALGNGNVIIADGQNNRVIEVNQAKQIVWQYGTTGSPGSGPNQLGLPVSAFEVASGVEGDAEPPSTPANVRISKVTSDRIDLTWNASTDNKGVAGYNVYNAATDELIAATTATSFSHAGLTPDTPHTYCVKAYDASGNLSERSQIVSARTLYGEVPTQAPNVGINLGSNIVIEFDNITGAGTTSASITYDTTATPPSGFSIISNYIDITTTASYEGTITVSLPYDDAGMTADDEQSLMLLHWNGSVWENTTVSIDTEANIITGEVSSLSPFVVVGPQGTGGGPSSGSSVGFGMNTNLMLALSLFLLFAGLSLLLRRNPGVY